MYRYTKKLWTYKESVRHLRTLSPPISIERHTKLRHIFNESTPFPILPQRKSLCDNIILQFHRCSKVVES